MKDKTGLPVFEETMRQLGDLGIRRDSVGRWTHVEVAEGWYQSLGGTLYHYDGIVWDVVPAERVEELEYLG